MRRSSNRNPQAGMTLLEIMIASTIMVIMMTLVWRTISNTSDARRTFGKYQERNHELRMALGTMVNDFESAYLSTNEDTTQTHRRTMFISKTGSKVPDISFSTLNHRVLWSDANESEQTVITYLAVNDREKSEQVNLLRREQRRPSNKDPKEEPAEYDVLVRDIQKVEIKFWSYVALEWQDTWDTTQADGNKDTLPGRVRITLYVKGPEDREIKLSTEARIYMDEPLQFNPRSK
jgi:prepilin-type N-terminal cleavage/methylation domain-containing protein